MVHKVDQINQRSAVDQNAVIYQSFMQCRSIAGARFSKILGKILSFA